MMKLNILLLAVLISESCLAGEYSDCILENTKGINDSLIARQIEAACRKQSLPYVPAKCRNLPLTHTPSSQFSGLVGNYKALTATDADCVESCLDASYWSKHFGECKE